MRQYDEPTNLREWKPASGQASGRLFSCGRPGRGTLGRARCSVGEDILEAWVTGLPSADPLHIISLLGRKKDGFSEFSYYPFRSASEERVDKPTFEAWLNGHHASRFVVHEFPTVDATGIPPADLAAAARLAQQLLANGNTVLVLDSAGAQRTARVCERIGWH